MIVLFREDEGMLLRIVNEFDVVYKRRNLRVNAGKSNDTVFERGRELITDLCKTIES